MEIIGKQNKEPDYKYKIGDRIIRNNIEVGYVSKIKNGEVIIKLNDTDEAKRLYDLMIQPIGLSVGTT